METQTETTSPAVISPQPVSKPTENSGLAVHQILAVSYLVYFIAIFLGYILSFAWDIKFSSVMFNSLGLIFIFLGTFLCFWAQYVSGQGSPARNAAPDNVSHSNFFAGPYMYTRSPTQYGLLLMALGLSFLYGSVVMIIATVIAFILGKFVFIPIEEYHLEQKYGQPYRDYKHKVKF